MDSVTLRQEIHDKIEGIGAAYILVGILSYNNASTIGHVVKAVQIGLSKYFPDNKSVIVNSDGGSADDTIAIVQNTTLKDIRSVLLYHRVVPVYCL